MFESKKVKTPFVIKFRTSGDPAQYTFDASDTVGLVFEYVSSHLRDNFEQKDCEFDLTQAFPPLSLK